MGRHVPASMYASTSSGARDQGGLQGIGGKE
jgi:hypothetical protein